MREREETLAVAYGPGEGAAHVPEELRLEQRRREGGAVDRLEGRPPARALRVNRPGYELLARPGFAADQDRALGAGDPPQLGEERLHLGRHREDAVEGAQPEMRRGLQDGAQRVATL